MDDFVKNFAPIFSILIALLAIIVGFHAWKRQFIGSRRIALLEDVLTGFYQARDSIADIRNPVIFEGEGSTVKPQQTKQSNVDTDTQAFYVIIERFSRHNGLFTKLQVQKYRFMATFGAEKAEPFERLSKLLNDLAFTNNFLNHPESGIEHYQPPFDESLKKLLVESRRKLYSSSDDPIKKEVEEIIGLIEKIVSNEMKKTI